MMTDIYVKMDALEPLLLSKGLCRQLGKVSYHLQVNASQPPAQEVGTTVSVPTVKVQLVQRVKLPRRSRTRASLLM